MICKLAGEARLHQGTLFSSHVSEWEALWQRGRIDLTGNITMALTTNAALYYLLSALPLEADSLWPFVGMAPGGLAHGGASKVRVFVAVFNGSIFFFFCDGVTARKGV